MGEHLINCTILGKSFFGERVFRAGERILPYYNSGKINFCLKVCQRTNIGTICRDRRSTAVRSRSGSNNHSDCYSLPLRRFATSTVRVKMKDLYKIMLTNVCYSTDLQCESLCIHGRSRTPVPTIKIQFTPVNPHLSYKLQTHEKTKCRSVPIFYTCLTNLLLRAMINAYNIKKGLYYESEYMQQLRIRSLLSGQQSLLPYLRCDHADRGRTRNVVLSD